MFRLFHERKAHSRAAILPLTLIAAAVATLATVAQATVLPSAGKQKDRSMTVFSDTRLMDPRYGSFVQARIDHLKLNDLEHMSLITHDGIDVLGYTGNEEIEVTLFLPDDLPKEDEEAFVHEVGVRLNKRFSRTVFRIERTYIPAGVFDADPLGSVKDRTGNEVVDVYRTWRERTVGLARAIRQKSFEPEAVDLVVGSMIGGLRTVGGAAYWLTVSGFNVYGGSQALITFALNQIFSRYPVQINKWKAEHTLPFLKSNALVKFYNSHPYVKTVTVNELLVLSIQSTLRWFSHLVSPSAIASPLSAEFLVTFFGMSILRTPLGAAEDMGVLTLLKKGYLTRRSSHYLLNILGLEGQVSGLLFAAGRLRWLPAVLAVEWTSKAVVWLFSQYLPARSHRIFLVHPEVDERNLDQFEYVHDLRDLLLNGDTVTKERFQELLERSGYRLSEEAGNSFFPSSSSTSRARAPDVHVQPDVSQGG